ncbi:uncharacterized protein LOC127877891 [Dreissena polymorpha]|uniref:CUB domain-containing protein n=1 Tax=Dreissena polymorpha TaxID=45954 RepID=A0A9D4RVK6_DREPO|nr:uncharacterized protein LOC127877891 [Dreissena polymorpha]KAH3880408.1 hypothetical protein DPMN_004322 [Dreissena polymorpha]
MKSVLVFLILRVVAAVDHSVVIDSNSCGTEFFINEEDEITLEYDGRTLSEDCWIDFSTENLETREMCFKPEKFLIYRDSGLIVEYHKDLITPQSDEEFDYYRQDTSEWCDSASKVFMVLRAGDQPSKYNADIKIKARVHDNGDNLEYIGYTIIGFLIGVVVLVIAACVIALICCYRKQKNRGQVFKQQCDTTTVSTYPSAQQSPQAGYQPKGGKKAGYQPHTGSPSSFQAEYQPPDKADSLAPPPPYSAYT